MSILSATVSPVKIGIIEIEGLMTEKGDYAIGVPQITDLVQLLSHNASRDIKALLGKEFRFLTLKTKLNPKAINALTLKDFEQLLFELALKGNQAAIAFVRLLFGLSLHQLFCDAFGVKFEAEERQQWLFARMGSKDAFWQLGESIEIYKPKHMDRSDNYRKFLYSNCQDRVNRGLFGKPAKKIREELGVADHVLIRDYYNRVALSRIDKIQELASVQIIHKDIEPQDAVKFALDNYRYECMHYGK